MNKSFFFILFSIFTVGARSQTILHHKWVLMSIDNLDNGLKKVIGDYVIASLIFETDTSYSGNFCNNYHGHVKFNQSKGCSMSIPFSGKRQCMGYTDVENDLFKLYPLVERYVLKANFLYLFTSDKKRLVFKSE